MLTALRCSIKMSKQARDVVRQITKLTQLFSKKRPLPTHTLSGLGTDTVSVDLAVVSLTTALMDEK